MDKSIKTEETSKDDNAKTPSQRRKKLRGKLLYKIKDQMEFYFSHANLRRDRFLGNLVRSNPDGYVHAEVFLTFNQIRKLTDNVEDILMAVAKSDVLEVSPDGKKIRVKNQESDPVKNYDDCVIYVERLPQLCDYKYVKNIFSQFGYISYVSLPRFRGSNKVKGFAFVEFDSPDSAKRACDAYKPEGEIKESAIKTHKSASSESKKKSVDFSPAKNKEDLAQKSPRKRKRSENEKTPEKPPKSGVMSAEEEEKVPEDREETSNKGACKKHKKRKRQSSESEPTEKKQRLLSESATDEPQKDHDEDKVHKHTSKDEVGDHSAKDSLHDEEHESDKDIVSSAKRVKLEVSDKNQADSGKIDEVTKEVKDVEEKMEEVEQSQDAAQKPKKRNRKKRGESDTQKLRVLSKAEWKNCKNRYLSMQKKAMSSLKKMLLVNKKQQAECEAMLSTEEGQPQEPSVEEVQDVNMPNNKIEFQPGVIAKLTLTKVVTAPSELIKLIKSKTNVAFVDLLENNKEAYLRFPDSAHAKETLKEDLLSEFGSAKMITGTEETAYWEKLAKDREMHFNRMRTNKRGRDKIITKATALMKQKSTHIHFDESF